MTIRISYCRSCRAQIMWTKTENNKSMPVDLDPTPDGEYILVDKGNEPVVHRLAVDETATGDRYTSHFVTCPQSRQWSKHQ